MLRVLFLYVVWPFTLSICIFSLSPVSVHVLSPFPPNPDFLLWITSSDFHICGLRLGKAVVFVIHGDMCVVRRWAKIESQKSRRSKVQLLRTDVCCSREDSHKDKYSFSLDWYYPIYSLCILKIPTSHKELPSTASCVRMYVKHLDKKDGKWVVLIFK